MIQSNCYTMEIRIDDRSIFVNGVFFEFVSIIKYTTNQ